MSGYKIVLDPDRLADVAVDKVLGAASAGFLGIDNRFLHAILDRTGHSLPELIRFAAESHEDDPVEIDSVLLDIFRQLKTPEAVPYLISLVKRDPENIDDELVEALVPFGAALVDPLIELIEQLERDNVDPNDVLFLLSQLRLRDSRILNAVTMRLERGNPDAALFLDMHGDPAAIPALQAAIDRLPADDMDRPRLQSFIQDLASPHEPVEEETEEFDIWSVYPESDVPPIDFLEDADRLLMLDEGTTELRTAVAAFYRGANLSDQVAARLLDHARNDPDAEVRGECWESLEDRSDEPEVRRMMLAILKDANTAIEEKGGVAVALAQQADNPVVYQAIENLYANAQGRAKALKAMGRSFDRRFAEYPPRHLDDPDPAIKRQAIWAVGYLNLPSEAPRLEKFFEDEEFRSDALFAYALSAPGDTSRGRIRSLLAKIRNAAGGFHLDERELVETALDQRLMLHGMKPVFSADDSEDPADEPVIKPAESAKVGRNDPCPCGSGKKYKKCCGA